MPADALSNMLDLLHAECRLSGPMAAGGAWADRSGPAGHIRVYAATKGSCWFFMDGLPAPTRFNAGDVLMANGTRALALASDPALIAGAMVNPPPKCRPDAEGVYRQGQGDDFQLLGGGVQIDADRPGLLQSGLPPLIHVRGDAPEAAPLAWLVDQLVKETGPDGRAGRSTAITALAQLLFVHTLRAYLETDPVSDTGWLKVFNDRRLTAALSSMHENPAHNWSLDELASMAGMSRTSFAVQFRQVMGMPPLTYLTCWRMRLAQHALRSGASVREAAAKVGYSSQSAFNEAFRRATGRPPGLYRRTAGARDSRRPRGLADALPSLQQALNDRGLIGRRRLRETSEVPV